MNKYDQMIESEIDPEWELIKGDEHRLTKDEQIRVMRTAKKHKMKNFKVRIKKNEVYIYQ